MHLTEHELVEEGFARNLEVSRRLVVAHLHDAAMNLDWTFDQVVDDRVGVESARHALQQGVEYSGAGGLTLSRESEASYAGRRRKVATFIDQFRLGGLSNFDEVPYSSIIARRSRTLHRGGFRTPRSFEDYSVGLSANYDGNRSVAFDILQRTQDEPLYIVRIGNGLSTDQLGRAEIFDEWGRPKAGMTTILQDLNFAARVLRIGVQNRRLLDPVGSGDGASEADSSNVSEDPYPVIDSFAQRLRDGLSRGL